MITSPLSRLISSKELIDDIDGLIKALEYRHSLYKVLRSMNARANLPPYQLVKDLIDARASVSSWLRSQTECAEYVDSVLAEITIGKLLLIIGNETDFYFYPNLTDVVLTTEKHPSGCEWDSLNRARFASLGYSHITKATFAPDRANSFSGSIGMISFMRCVDSARHLDLDVHEQFALLNCPAISVLEFVWRCFVSQLFYLYGRSHYTSGRHCKPHLEERFSVGDLGVCRFTYQDRNSYTSVRKYYEVHSNIHALADGRLSVEKGGEMITSQVFDDCAFDKYLYRQADESLVISEMFRKALLHGYYPILKTFPESQLYLCLPERFTFSGSDKAAVDLSDSRTCGCSVKDLADLAIFGKSQKLKVDLGSQFFSSYEPKFLTGRMVAEIYEKYEQPLYRAFNDSTYVMSLPARPEKLDQVSIDPGCGPLENWYRMTLQVADTGYARFVPEYRTTLQLGPDEYIHSIRDTPAPGYQKDGNYYVLVNSGLVQSGCIDASIKRYGCALIAYNAAAAVAAIGHVPRVFPIMLATAFRDDCAYRDEILRYWGVKVKKTYVFRDQQSFHRLVKKGLFVVKISKWKHKFDHYIWVWDGNCCDGTKEKYFLDMPTAHRFDVYAIGR